MPTGTPMGIVKSVTALERLFMVDILVTSNEEFELVLHFVNAERNPAIAPTIKRFFLKNELSVKEFLKQFEAVAARSSPYYRK